MAIHSPSEQMYIVALGFTKFMVPSVLSLQSSGSRELTILRLSLVIVSSLLQDVTKIVNAAHIAAVERRLINTVFSLFFLTPIIEIFVYNCAFFAFCMKKTILPLTTGVGLV